MICSRKLRFLISATIAAETGTASITIFDRVAKQLLQKEASDLVLKEEYTDPHIIPPPLLALRQQMKTFHLHTPDPRRYRRTIFTVSKISEPTNTTEPASSTPPHEPTQGKNQVTPAPEIPAAKSHKCLKQ